MSGNKKNTAESPQSRIAAVNQKNIEIHQKNPNLILQFQNQMKAAGLKLKHLYNTIKDSKTHNILDKSIDPIGFVYENSFEHSAGKNLIYQLTKLQERAKKYRNTEVEEKVVKVIKNLPTSRKRGLDHRIAEIEEIAKTGKPNLSKEFEAVRKTYDKFGSPIINEANKANKVKQISNLKKAGKWLKTGKKVGHALEGVSTYFDISSLFEFHDKLQQKKANIGDWGGAAKSAISVLGKVAELISKHAAKAEVAEVAGLIGERAALINAYAVPFEIVLAFDLIPLPEKPKPKSKPVMPINSFNTSGLFGNNVINNVIPENARVTSEAFRKIPGNARGTSYFSGGLSLVGEEGPELVNLPRGSQVFSNSRTKSLLSGMGGGNAGISINYSPQITIQGNADAKVMKTASDSSYADFERKFNALMDRRRRLSFAGG